MKAVDFHKKHKVKDLYGYEDEMIKAEGGVESFPQLLDKLPPEEAI